MPNSTDNQDLKENNAPTDEKNTPSPSNGNSKGEASQPDRKDENNFTSDDQKGKKVDGDPEKEEDQPAGI